MIDFTKAPCMYWSDVTKISYLQRRILVYSIMYYEMNESCISDMEYDEISKQLVSMQHNVSKADLARTTYYYVFKDFEGSTGFDLFSKLNVKDREFLSKIAKHVYYQWAQTQY